MFNKTDRRTWPALIPGLAFSLIAATDRGKRWIDDHTTETVVCGVGAVLLVVRSVLDPASWRRVVLAFALAGSPLVVRAIWRRSTKRAESDV